MAPRNKKKEAEEAAEILGVIRTDESRIARSRFVCHAGTYRSDCAGNSQI